MFTHPEAPQETHPDPPCREGGKDKETLSNLPIERVEVGLRGESPVGLLWVSGVGP